MYCHSLSHGGRQKENCNAVHSVEKLAVTLLSTTVKYRLKGSALRCVSSLYTTQVKLAFLWSAQCQHSAVRVYGLWSLAVRSGCQLSPITCVTVVANRREQTNIKTSVVTGRHFSIQPPCVTPHRHPLNTCTLTCRVTSAVTHVILRSDDIGSGGGGGGGGGDTRSD